ncbi:hypothetical protein Taro_034756, partial [Colocasia esculenta]|nr:hypothetical protein [Colocasia esculenta]
LAGHCWLQAPGYRQLVCWLAKLGGDACSAAIHEREAPRPRQLTGYEHDSREERAALRDLPPPLFLPADEQQQQRRGRPAQQQRGRAAVEAGRRHGRSGGASKGGRAREAGSSPEQQQRRAAVVQAAAVEASGSDGGALPPSFPAPVFFSYLPWESPVGSDGRGVLRPAQAGTGAAQTQAAGQSKNLIFCRFELAELDQVHDIGGDYLEPKVMETQLAVSQAETAITSTKIMQVMNWREMTTLLMRDRAVHAILLYMLTF